ncbi:MAG TPA: response regulator transcription factor [Polyangia bacterium]|jgi:DNA-binding NarL/FixJ family response regulator|nr:response regulator transcription factor [Polyangia bacterium]
MRIVLIAGEPAFRLGVGVAVERAGDLQLVGDAADARAGFAAVDTANPEVVIIDIALRGMNGIEATREIRRRSPRTQVLLVAAWPRERDVLEGFAAGATGYALKTDPVEALRDAIRTVATGQRYLSPELRGSSVEAASRAQASDGRRDVLHALSLREREVLGLVVKGCRSRDIARELCISIKTVETHRNHINRKLGCASAADLTRFAAENGLLRPSPGGADDRLLVMLVGDQPELRADLLRAAEARGYQLGRAASPRQALSEAQSAAAPALMMVEDGVGRVRAVGNLTRSDADQWLLSAVDRPEAKPNGTVVSLGTA